MCSHKWIECNDVTACVKCGLTRIRDGKVIFDKRLPNYKLKKRRVKKNA